MRVSARRALIGLAAFGVLLWIGESQVRSGFHHFHGLTPADMTTVDIAGPPEAVVTRLQGATFQKAQRTAFVSADFRTGQGGIYRDLQLGWRDTNAAPTSLSVTPAGTASSAPTELRARLDSVLHGGVDPNGQWRVNGILFELDPDGGLIFQIDPKPNQKDNPRFVRQSQIALRVLAFAAFGEPLGVGDQEMRDTFGFGYPVRDLAKIDPATVVENAESATHAVFPGAAFEDQRLGMVATIALDHPVVSFARMSWLPRDSAIGAGELRGIAFIPSDDFAKKTDAFTGCISKALGDPIRSSGVSGEVVLTFWIGEPTTGLVISPKSIELISTHVIAPAAWHTVVGALDACR